MKTGTFEQFKVREIALNKALTRVQTKLGAYRENPNNPNRDWNNWHDLEDRLMHRIYKNWSMYKDWHWEQTGFNTYP